MVVVVVVVGIFGGWGGTGRAAAGTRGWERRDSSDFISEGDTLGGTRTGTVGTLSRCGTENGEGLTGEAQIRHGGRILARGGGRWERSWMSGGDGFTAIV